MGLVYIDIETDNSQGFGLDPFRSKVVTFQIMFPSGKKFILTNPETMEPFKEKLEKSIVVGHNLKFEAEFLKYHFGITLKNVYDTMLVEQIISGGQLAGYAKGKSLKDLTLKYCKINLDKTEQCNFKAGEPLTESQIKYALLDVAYLPEIMQQQKVRIVQLNLENIVAIEMKCLPAVAWLELSGINVDLVKLEGIKTKIQEQQAYSRDFLAVTLGENVNLNSPKQLLAALQAKDFDLKGTGKSDLAKYNDNKIIQTLNQYREASKLLSGFINPLPEFINPVTKRVHASFNQYGALSGRLTSEKPNLQQQPSRFSSWREIFRATPGYKIIAADYSQIELRIVGQLAKDSRYIQAYNEGLDLHKETAAHIFKVPVDQVTKQQRGIAKSINFGLNYGMWTNGLKSAIKNNVGVDITLEEAKQFISSFQELYPAVTKHLSKTSREGLQKLQVKTAAGRLCRFNPPKDEQEQGSIKRESKNLPVQGLCADMIKIAMSTIFLTLEPKNVKFVNMIHDELVFECPEDLVSEASEIIKAEMEKAGSKFLTDIPCIAEVTISDFWKKN